MLSTTTQDWHDNATLNMNQANFSQKRAAMQCDMSKNVHAETVSSNLQAYNALHQSLEQKVNTSYRLMDKLDKRANSIENSLKQSKLALNDLQNANTSFDGPLQLCVWRMRQREQRPLREQVRDIVEVALEEEKRFLVDSQRQMGDAERQMKNVIQALKVKLDDVKHDLDQKGQALGVDEMCLRSTQRSWQTVAERGARTPPIVMDTRPHTPSRKLAAGHHENVRNESNRQTDVDRLDRSAEACEEGAKQMRDEVARLVHGAERGAEDAANKTERTLQSRINENQQVRRRLADELQNTQHKMDHTKHTIVETRSQIKALEEPVELGAACNTWRNQRAHREQIQDPVSSRLAEHQSAVLRSLEDLQRHNESEKNILSELTSRRSRLKEDLKDKTSALHIDLNCLTHQSQHYNGQSSRNISRDRLDLATKVDPMFVPMATATISDLRARSVGGGSLSSPRSPMSMMSTMSARGRSVAR
eukprot:TRINITY_DN8286_c1_g1_i1.p1 TRINITY_DN8286_c1_g1~~TRINITY_DN8286_c1_g1_i1.p1  ORF type:complete len:476 (+),score=80.17 TRINITY_DN8286_c1_g1_i1:103-1530(+)